MQEGKDGPRREVNAADHTLPRLDARVVRRRLRRRRLGLRTEIRSHPRECPTDHSRHDPRRPSRLLRVREGHQPEHRPPRAKVEDLYPGVRHFELDPTHPRVPAHRQAPHLARRALGCRRTAHPDGRDRRAQRLEEPPGAGHLCGRGDPGHSLASRGLRHRRIRGGAVVEARLLDRRRLRALR